MPIRPFYPQHSDRGSLKDLQHNDNDQSPPTTYELRVKELYEHASANQDEAMISSLGFIPINGSPTDPISVFRHREYVNSLSDKLAQQVQQTVSELAPCFANYPIGDFLKTSQEKRNQSRQTILAPDSFIKTAGKKMVAAIQRSFRRIVR
jgi:hypothetical protein